ncbi:MAG: DsbC family protein [bacterium]
MNSYRRLKATILTSLLASVLASGMATGSEEIPKPLSDRLKQLVPTQQPDSIKQTPLKNLYEVVYGGDVLYLSGDGNFLVQGALIDLKNGINLTKNTQAGYRKKILATISDDQTIMYKPEGETKHTITVFTDVDCPYCRRLHSEMDQYLKGGVAVRYLLYPRSGYGTPSSDKLVTAWCSDDKQQALTDEKNGKGLPKKTCENPVQAHLKLGEQVGVTGTPAILLENGQLIPGYRPAADMIRMLDKMKAAEK